MLLETISEIKVFEHFIKNCYVEYTIEKLSKETKISIPQLYKIIKSLLNKNLLKKKGNLIKANMDAEYTYYFKLLYDRERLERLPSEFRIKVHDVLEEIRHHYSDAHFSVIIFGSCANEESKSREDIDILMITYKTEIDLKNLDIPDKVHIISKTLNELREDFRKGDDFLKSILMNHFIYFDAMKYFYKLLSMDWFPSNEIIELRKEQLERLKGRLLNYIKKKDIENSKRLLKEYFILKLRIKWLKDDKIPKSKYELLKSEGLLKDYENIDKLKNIEKMIRYV